MAFNLNKFYTWCIQTCNAPDVGYSLDYRCQQTVNGITYYDCSSFVFYALIAGGFTDLPSYPFVTYDMLSYLIAGGWHEVSATGTILPGDIGWNWEHVEVAYARGENGVAIFMGAHDDAYPLADQVSIGVAGDPTVPRNFSRVFRYGEGGATESPLSLPVVAALAGNGWVESYLNPTTDIAQGTAAGLWLWKNQRLTDMHTWMDQEGYDYDDPTGQMRYLVHEDFWQGSFGGYTTLDEFFDSTSTDIDQLTEAFMVCWERATAPAYLQNRIDFAHDAYDYINLHAQDAQITSWEVDPEDPQDQHITREQALKNAVLLYRFFSAGGGGGGIPTEPKHRMPLWMKIRYHY